MGDPQPGHPARPVHLPARHGPAGVQADGREPQSGHQRRRRRSSRSASPAPRRPSSRSRSPAGSRRRCAASTASTRSTRRSARAAAPPSSCSRSARRSTARSPTCATRSPASAATCPTASSSRRSAARTSTDEPIGYFSAESTAMTVEQLSWFIDDTLNRRLMGIEGVSIVSRTGGVSREIRVELDPVRMQAQGVTASQINQQLRAINMNAAGGRAEIAGSEQSVRVLGSALTAHAARRNPDLARRRPHDPAQFGRQRPRPMGRADLLRHPERPPGGQLHDPEGQGLFRRHRLSRGHAASSRRWSARIRGSTTPCSSRR